MPFKEVEKIVDKMNRQLENSDHMRRKIISLATTLALQDSEKTGSNYTKCISKALEEACIRLGVNSKGLIRMFR